MYIWLINCCWLLSWVGKIGNVLIYVIIRVRPGVLSIFKVHFFSEEWLFRQKSCRFHISLLNIEKWFGLQVKVLRLILNPVTSIKIQLALLLLILLKLQCRQILHYFGKKVSLVTGTGLIWSLALQWFKKELSHSVRKRECMRPSPKCLFFRDGLDWFAPSWRSSIWLCNWDFYSSSP